jgi:cytoskeletal protein CcmA (bactofilin family)
MAAHIGESISIQGGLAGEEDLVIDGKVDGKVDLPGNHLTVGQSGVVKADVNAGIVTVVGRVNGNVRATERVQIETTGVVEGDVSAPRLVVQEGAVLNGSIEMSGNAAPAGARPQAAAGAAAAKPAVASP